MPAGEAKGRPIVVLASGGRVCMAAAALGISYLVSKYFVAAASPRCGSARIAFRGQRDPRASKYFERLERSRNGAAKKGRQIFLHISKTLSD